MAEKLPKDVPAIDVAGISKSFDSQLVLQDIDLNLAAGQILCICGPNAAGKTTLLRIMAGLLQPTAGTVRICGFDVQKQPQRVKPILGAIFHKSMLYSQLTVIENLQFFAGLYGLRDSEAHIKELLEQVDLLPYRYDRAGILSRGMLQRLAIARAMVHRPTVLLADEPFTGLDTDARKSLVAILKSFKGQGRAIVMTTHDVSLALQCCDRVAVLDKGKLILNVNVCQIDMDAFTKDYLLYARENSCAASETL